MRKSKEQMSISGFNKNNSNPYLKDLVVPNTLKLNLRGQLENNAVIDIKKNEINEDAIFFSTKKKIEIEEFIKVFTSKLQKFFDLSPTGIRVFCYISKILKYEDYFNLDWEEAMKYTKYKSKVSIINGLIELLNADIIARGNNPYFYYINPTIFYKGNRLTLVEQYETEVERPFKFYEIND